MTAAFTSRGLARKPWAPQMRRGLAHELVHACLTSIPSGDAPWPAWLQEGLAQKLSGDKLEPAVREQLQQLARMRINAAPGRAASGLVAHERRAKRARAYNVSLAAADALYENYAG